MEFAVFGNEIFVGFEFHNVQIDIEILTVCWSED